MAKKVLSVVLGGIAILLALVYALILLLDNQRLFGQAITWLLCGCVIVLMAFILYLMISWSIDAVRKRHHNEDSLDEESLEKILSGELTHKSAVRAVAKRENPSRQKKQAKKAMEREKSIRKQEEYEAKKAAEQAAAQKKLAAEEERQRADIQAKLDHIISEEAEALKRAAALTDPEEKRLALSEAEALRRAAQQTQTRLEAEEIRLQAEKKQREENEKLQQLAAEQRKTQAIESARKQAEANATARRRAAQTAAQTQSFPAITIENLAAINAHLQNTAALGNTPPVEPKITQPQKDPSEMNLWERMSVKQSAAPTLSGSESSKSDDAAKSWTYTPAKLPDAWKSDSSRKIPGDMTYVSSIISKSSANKEVEQAETGTSAAKRPASRPVKPTAEGMESVAKRPPGRPAKPKAEEPEQAVKRPRGRPPKPKTEDSAEVVKRPPGRPPKPKTAETGEVIKRPPGRPPKPKTEDSAEVVKRPPGRPPKPKTDEPAEAIKRPRGRPPKPKTDEPAEAIKRPRGRPPKPKAEDTPQG